MSDITNLEQALLESPAARARFLANTLEILQENGVDIEAPAFQEHLRGALDLTDGPSFLRGLQATTLAVAGGGQGQGGGQSEAFTASRLGKVASSVVIVAASAGQRGAFGGQLGQAASSVVIVAASAGQRGAFGGQLGRAASSVVIVAASAGAFGGQLGQAASSVVIVAASAGQLGAIGAQTNVGAIGAAGLRGAMGGQFGQESAPQPEQQGEQQGGLRVIVPAAATIEEIAVGLRALADLLSLESEGLTAQIAEIAAQGNQGNQSQKGKGKAGHAANH